MNAVCREEEDRSIEKPVAPVVNDRDRPAPGANDSSGPWAEDVLSLYGGEAYL